MIKVGVAFFIIYAFFNNLVIKIIACMFHSILISVMIRMDEEISQ